MAIFIKILSLANDVNNFMRPRGHEAENELMTEFFIEFVIAFFFGVTSEDDSNRRHQVVIHKINNWRVAKDFEVEGIFSWFYLLL